MLLPLGLGLEPDGWGAMLLYRATRTSFPSQANAAILGGALAFLASHLFICQAIKRMPGDAIEKIGDEIVFDRAKVGFRRFKLKSVIFSIVLTLGCVLVNLFGPASRFDTCGDGACLQGNPFVFVLTVSMFYGLAYLCDVGLGMWVRAMWADMKGERY